MAEKEKPASNRQNAGKRPSLTSPALILLLFFLFFAELFRLVRFYEFIFKEGFLFNELYMTISITDVNTITP